MKQYFNSIVHRAATGKTFSKKAVYLLVALGMTIGFSCDDLEDMSEEGRKAAAEFCDCFETKSRNACLEELTEKYPYSTYISDDFIDAFNEAQDCGVTLKKEQIKQ
jgi:hypothetical protein